jgi:hypothetical protein
MKTETSERKMKQGQRDVRMKESSRKKTHQILSEISRREWVHHNSQWSRYSRCHFAVRE